MPVLLRAASKVLYWYKIQAVSKNTKYYVTALQNPHAKLQNNKLVEITSRVSVELELQLQRNNRLYTLISDTKSRNKHKNFLISLACVDSIGLLPFRILKPSRSQFDDYNTWAASHMSTFKTSRWTLSTRPQWRWDTSVATREAWKVQSWGGVYEPPTEWQHCRSQARTFLTYSRTEDLSLHRCPWRGSCGGSRWFALRYQWHCTYRKYSHLG